MTYSVEHDSTVVSTKQRDVRRGPWSEHNTQCPYHVLFLFSPQQRRPDEHTAQGAQGTIHATEVSAFVHRSAITVSLRRLVHVR